MGSTYHLHVTPSHIALCWVYKWPKVQGDTKFTSKIMVSLVHAIEKAIRPLFLQTRSQIVVCLHMYNNYYGSANYA